MFIYVLFSSYWHCYYIIIHPFTNVTNGNIDRIYHTCIRQKNRYLSSIILRKPKNHWPWNYLRSYYFEFKKKKLCVIERTCKNLMIYSTITRDFKYQRFGTQFIKLLFMELIISLSVHVTFLYCRTTRPELVIVTFLYCHAMCTELVIVYCTFCI